jgi:uncharacterized repeat protein (TIGR03843 family)
MSRDERALEAGLNDPAVPEVLARGDLEILGLMPNSSNYTFLTRASAGGDSLLGIYKPRRGEIPLWDFPEGTLCQREVAAFMVAEAIGWPRVPPTILRDGPEGVGSVQLFVEFDPEQHYFTLQEAHADAFRDVAVFDAVINNADRKGGHCLLGSDGGIFLIDHGVCFNEDPKLRTVIWEYVDEPIAPARLAALAELRDQLDGGPLRERLADLLSMGELDAMGRRTDELLRSGEMPRPGLERPYPWPPI